MKINLLGMSLDAMEKFFISMGEKPFRARQTFQWIHQKGISRFSDMTNLSKNLQSTLEKHACFSKVLCKFFERLVISENLEIPF